MITLYAGNSNIDAVSNNLIIALVVVVESPYGEAMLIVSKQVRSKEEFFNEVSWGVKNIFTSHPSKIYVEKNLILSLQNNCSLNFETAYLYKTTVHPAKVIIRFYINVNNYL